MIRIEQEVAELYGRLGDEIPTIRRPEIVRQFLFNVSLDAEWFAGKKCLDAGCGCGFAAWVMSELGGECHACDLQGQSLTRVRERLGEQRSTWLGGRQRRSSHPRGVQVWLR